MINTRNRGSGESSCHGAESSCHGAESSCYGAESSCHGAESSQTFTDMLVLNHWMLVPNH